MKFWNAFGDISTMRNFGMSAGPIPFDKIILWADYYQFSRRKTDELIRVIRAMDSVYLAEMSKRAKVNS